MPLLVFLNSLLKNAWKAIGRKTKMVERDANQEVTDDSEEVSTFEVGEAEELSGETAQRMLAERQRRSVLLTDEELDSREPDEGTLRKPMGPGVDDGVYEDTGPSEDIDDVDGDETEPAGPPSDA